MSRIRIYISVALIVSFCVFLCYSKNNSAAHRIKNNAPHQKHAKKWVDSLTDCEILLALDSEKSNVNWPYYFRRLEKATGIQSLVSMGFYGYSYLSHDLQVSDCVEWHLKLGCSIAPFPKNVLDSIHEKRDFYVKKRESYIIHVKEIDKK